MLPGVRIDHPASPRSRCRACTFSPLPRRGRWRAGEARPSSPVGGLLAGSGGECLTAAGPSSPLRGGEAWKICRPGFQAYRATCAQRVPPWALADLGEVLGRALIAPGGLLYSTPPCAEHRYRRRWYMRSWNGAAGLLRWAAGGAVEPSRLSARSGGARRRDLGCWVRVLRFLARLWSARIVVRGARLLAPVFLGFARLDTPISGKRESCLDAR